METQNETNGYEIARELKEKAKSKKIDMRLYLQKQILLSIQMLNEYNEQSIISNKELHDVRKMLNDGYDILSKETQKLLFGSD